MSLFPMIEAPNTALAASGTLPLAREAAWDFLQDQPIWRSGRPVYVTGADVVLVWARNCIHTERFAHDAFTTDYRQDLSGLMINPYITAVDQRFLRKRRAADLVQPDNYLWGGARP